MKGLGDMREIIDALKSKYDLEGLLDGSLDIDDVLSDEEVIDFLSCGKFKGEDIEEYILKNII